MIVFVVDAEAGLTPARLGGGRGAAHPPGRPCIVAANKADNPKRELEAAEFHSLGWEETLADQRAARPRRCGPARCGRLGAAARVGHGARAQARAREALDELDGTGTDLPLGADDEAAFAFDDRPARIAIIGRPERRQELAAQRLARRAARDRLRHPGHDARRDRHVLRVGRPHGSACRHGRHQPARQGRVRARSGAFRDAARAEGRVARGRRRPRDRCHGRTHGTGCARGRVRARGGDRPRRRDQQVGPRRGQDRHTFDEYVAASAPRSAIPGFRADRLDQRQDRPARRARPRGRARDRGRAAPARAHSGAQRVAARGDPAPAAVDRPGQAAALLLRDAGPDRAADVRALRQRRGAHPFQLPALPGKSAARGVRLPRHAAAADPPRASARGARAQAQQPTASASGSAQARLALAVAARRR